MDRAFQQSKRRLSRERSTDCVPRRRTSDHLACGRGLFALINADEVAAAVAETVRDFVGRLQALREIAYELLAEMGVDSRSQRF